MRYALPLLFSLLAGCKIDPCANQGPGTCIGLEVLEGSFRAGDLELLQVWLTIQSTAKQQVYSHIDALDLKSDGGSSVRLPVAVALLLGDIVIDPTQAVVQVDAFDAAGRRVSTGTNKTHIKPGDHPSLSITLGQPPSHDLGGDAQEPDLSPAESPPPIATQMSAITVNDAGTLTFELPDAAPDGSSLVAIIGATADVMPPSNGTWVKALETATYCQVFQYFCASCSGRTFPFTVSAPVVLLPSQAWGRLYQLKNPVRLMLAGDWTTGSGGLNPRLSRNDSPGLLAIASFCQFLYPVTPKNDVSISWAAYNGTSGWVELFHYPEHFQTSQLSLMVDWMKVEQMLPPTLVDAYTVTAPGAAVASGSWAGVIQSY
jgi:hypothetical protein